MAVFQTDGEPPSRGRTIFVNRGCTQNNSAAPTNMVAANSHNCACWTAAPFPLLMPETGRTLGEISGLEKHLAHEGEREPEHGS